MSFNPYEFDRSMSDQRSVETLGEYTSRTFLWMVLGLMITFATAMVSWMTGFVFYVVRAHLFILVGTLVLSFTMSYRIERMSVASAKGIFVAFSVLFGLTMSIYLLVFDLMSVIWTFLATALYFGVLAAYGHFTHADLSGFRSILFSGLIFLIGFSVLSIFIPGINSMDRMVSIIGIVVFLGYTAYDTQKIRNFYYYYSGYPDMLEKASVFSALQLYLDFLNLFLYLLRFLGNRKDN